MDYIIGFMLPDTFPSWMVPEETGLFMLTLVGKPLADAQMIAQEKGLMPTVGEIPGRDKSWRSFYVTADGMGIPFACRVASSTFGTIETRIN